MARTRRPHTHPLLKGLQSMIGARSLPVIDGVHERLADGHPPLRDLEAVLED